MRARLAVAVCIGAGMIVSFSQPATAQADVHAQAIARASCQSGKHSEAVVAAKAATEHDPDQIGPQMRLADALVDQGCYQEAVEILEAAQKTFPRSTELTGKLRDVRSLVTEQTYIEGLTQAAESAKAARSQLRCTELGDIAACDDALRAKPDDVALLTAKGDALMQANRPAEAAVDYKRSAQLKPGDDAVKTKLVNAEALLTRSVPAAAVQPTAASPAPRALTAGQDERKAPSAFRKAPAVVEAGRTPPAPPPHGGQHQPSVPATVAALAAPEPKTYSNDAPPGQTN